MNWMTDLNWFAIQTKPQQEKLAATHLAQLGIEIFLPMIRQEQAVCGSVRMVCKALFQGYLFACFRPDLSVDVVRYARGVLRVVGTSQFPVPLDEEIIQMIRSRIEDDGFVRLESPSFQPGDRVQIDDGPWQGTIGRFAQEMNDGKRVLILLDAIHQARLLVEKRWLRSVKEAD